MAELEHVVKIFSLLEAAEKEQPFLTREQKQDLYRIAFHKESMEEVEKIILQLQAPHAGKEEKERILYHYLEPFSQVPENILQIENYIFQLQYMTYEKEKANHMLEVLWSSIFVTLMANKIGGLQFGIYRNCQISSRVFHTAVAALPLTKANLSDFE